ncbi:probable RNA-binding protein 18 isoform X1 [Erinaceus europaeus]|uniref:Probable RNA-binding protein 18 n=1 Tax=Erinaceus europaeus TaxID=9365 RepID=A0ABM3Y4V0_ERIEU|nr:probable RNA-binding protein 18 isoform X1 [Erinaceus europaeus]
MEAETKTLPLENASILSEGSLQEGHRLWIGNLDPKITEYHLLKLLQKFGTVKQFDFLFHKSGALEGQPRGYCFVNFETKQEAEQAIQCLNGKLALSKKLVVRWAHAQVKRYDHNKNDKILPISLEPSSSTEPAQSNLSGVDSGETGFQDTLVRSSSQGSQVGIMVASTTWWLKSIKIQSKTKRLVIRNLKGKNVADEIWGGKARKSILGHTTFCLSVMSQKTLV